MGNAFVEFDGKQLPIDLVRTLWRNGIYHWSRISIMHDSEILDLGHVGPKQLAALRKNAPYDPKAIDYSPLVVYGYSDALLLAELQWRARHRENSKVLRTLGRLEQVLIHNKEETAAYETHEKQED